MRASLIFSLVFGGSCGLVLAFSGCVSDPPLLPDAGDDGGGETSTGADGGGDGAAPAKCVFQATPGRLKIHTFDGEDAGLPTQIDHERFGFFRLAGGTDAPSAVIATAPSMMNGGRSTVWAAVIPVNQGTPGKPVVASKQLATNRILQTFKTANGVGILSYEAATTQMPLKYGFGIHNVTDSDIQTTGLAQLTAFNQRAEISTSLGDYSTGNSGLARGLATDDYFISGFAEDKSASKIQMVAARLNSTNNTVVTQDTDHFVTGMAASAGLMHVFASAGLTGTTDYVLNDTTAVRQKTKDYPGDLIFAIAPNGTAGYAVTSVQVSGMSITGLRVGTTLSLDNIETSKLTQIPSIDLAGGATGGWWSPGSNVPPDFTVVGAPANGKGVAFLWLDAQGVMRGSAFGADLMLTDVPHVVVAAVVHTPTPGTFGLVWVSRDDNTNIDTLWYGKIRCQ